MFYAYETQAGSFMLEHQAFTESTWQLLLNEVFIDSFLSPSHAARGIARIGARIGICDAVLLPPADLSGWEVRWSKDFRGDAPELWLHRQYLHGPPRQGARAMVGSSHIRSVAQRTSFAASALSIAADAGSS